jgi:predicted Zn-dependent peptidase
MRVALSLLLLPGLLFGQNLKFEEKVTSFTLANGRHSWSLSGDAPVVSFRTYVNAGAVNDPTGRRLAPCSSTPRNADHRQQNWPAEKQALDAIERVYDRLDAERNKAFRADPKKIEALENELKAAIEKADSYVESNEYDRIVESNGGVGLNAGTAEDQTTYFYSFPSNRTELWFLLESERFLRPVFREFYKERDVVREERRMRIESSPQGS